MNEDTTSVDSRITYLEGDATLPAGDGPRVIAHVCNDIGAWGKGFVMAISGRWKEPQRQYKAWYKNGGDISFALGQVQFVPVEDDLWVANMIGQHGIRVSGSRIPLRYDALRQCLVTVAEFCLQHGATAHMPRIGCGLAGGDWEMVEPLLQETLSAKGIDVFVYDFTTPDS